MTPEPPDDEPLTILFEDEHLLGVSKPAGLLTQAAPWRGPTLEGAVRRYLSPEDPASVYLGTVHRLDRPVSGAIVWAKTVKAARRLSKEFEARRVRKEYWAVCECGQAPEAEGCWEDWLLPHSDPSGVVPISTPDDPTARLAVTRFHRDSRPGSRLPEGLTWLRLLPETGRTHQLRVQCARHGSPILGDAPYGSSRPFPSGIALHARSLTFRHPVLRDELTLDAPVPQAWRASGIDLEVTRS